MFLVYAISISTVFPFILSFNITPQSPTDQARYVWFPGVTHDADSYYFADHVYIINPFSAGIDFRRQNLTSADVRFRRLKSIPALKKYRFIISMVIQMTQKKLTKTFMMISNWKNTFVSRVYIKICRCSRVKRSHIHTHPTWATVSTREADWVTHVIMSQ